MASVFKRGGKQNRSGYWYVQWFDHDGKRHTKCAKTTDKAAAERIAATYESDSALRREGVIDPSQDRYAIQAKRLLSEHLADFKASLVARGNTGQHCHETFTQSEKMIAECKATYIVDLTPHSVQAAIKSLIDKGRSLKTGNHYLRSIKSFSRWLEREKRARTDNLAILEAYNAD